MASHPLLLSYTAYSPFISRLSVANSRLSVANSRLSVAILLWWLALEWLPELLYIDVLIANKYNEF